ncbi:Uma2 family endonuclease [Pseudonocardia sp. 73-21]|uniref:Uma2 family endonuclease n=2 Tax=unclassified Pseudonocardia TaxID=2619320 RepID=UPI002604FB80|nr:Uma2 family endonuclease [Pseudonocardia sp. 73-21]
MDHSVFDHEGPWTEDAYLGLSVPGDGRVELVDGALVVGPGATPERVRVVAAVRDTVTTALPDGLRVVGPVPLRLGTDCVLVPDLVVTRTADDDEPADPVLDAADALMVIEVVGADHGALDRSFKPQLYARSRIPYSLLVDHDVPFAVANMIISGRYHEYAQASAHEALRVEEPFALEIDLAAAGGRDREPEEQDVVPAGGSASK